MTAPVTREQLMAVVEGSPKAVGAHDRSTWVACLPATDRSMTL